MSEFEGVQSEGSDQGAEGGGDDFVSNYLNEVPEDYRPHVEPYLRNIESNANERFREHAEYKKQWEPYEGISLNDYDPQGLQELIQFAEKMADPDSFRDWWQTTGTDAGFFNQEGEEGDEEVEGLEGLDLDAFKSALDEVLNERLAPMQQREQQREQEEALQKADSAINEQMEALKEKHGEFDEQAVFRFAYALADSSDNPIEDGFKQYMDLVANVENRTVTGKLNTPTPPESGNGPANTNSQAPTSFDDAKAMARERLAQMNQ